MNLQIAYGSDLKPKLLSKRRWRPPSFLHSVCDPSWGGISPLKKIAPIRPGSHYSRTGYGK
ncbi:MAG: hypothetical protein WA637_22200, partial [Terriglobales bacterium]